MQLFYLLISDNIHISSQKLSEILPTADCFITNMSSTISWSILCGIKTIIYDPIKPTIDKGRQSNGRTSPREKHPIEPINANIIPPPVGVGMICELLKIGLSIIYFLRNGISEK